MIKRIVGGLATLAFIAGPALAQKSADWAPETFTLDNGMEVVVLPDHRAPVVTHMVWYKVGAVDEVPGKSGIAHLFEHVMFKGTDDIGPDEFSSIVSRIGGQLNAFTSWDYTAYYERVAKQYLGEMMGLEAERMRDLVINDDPDGSFISERDVVKEERRQRIDNNPGVILQEKVMAALWKGHPYEITVIGKMDEVSALTPQDGRDFYHKYYSPENAILVVAGDVTGEEVRSLAQENYGKIPRTGLVDGKRNWRPVPELTETTLITHSDPKVRQPVWSRYYSGTSETRNKDLSYALDVGLDVLGNGMTSRLYQALVEDQKIAISVGTYAWTGLHDEGPVVVTASPVQGVSLDDLETAIMAEIDKVLAEGFSDAEVVRACNSLAATAIYARDSQAGMANLYGSTLALGGSVEDIQSYADDMRAVTTEEALAAVRWAFGKDRHYVEAHLLPAAGEE